MAVYTFPYTKHGEVYRPIIPIEVAALSSMRYEVLVDSGADMCMFHAEVGEAIGLAVEDGKPFEFGGIIGAEQVAYLHEIIVTIQGHTFTTTVGFSYSISDSSYGIMGQAGFFDHFIVTMSLADAKVELRTKTRA